MTRNVGFEGGHSIYELGPVSDVELFFECVSKLLVSKHHDQDWSLLLDRLYRRYLRQEELDSAQKLINLVREEFSALSSQLVEWKNLPDGSSQTWLNPNQATLADIFEKYFQRFSDARLSAESLFQEFRIYKPIKIVVIDFRKLMRDKNKTLAEYDALEGMPFWLR